MKKNYLTSSPRKGREDKTPVKTKVFTGVFSSSEHKFCRFNLYWPLYYINVITTNFSSTARGMLKLDMEGVEIEY